MTAPIVTKVAAGIRQIDTLGKISLNPPNGATTLLVLADATNPPSQIVEHYEQFQITYPVTAVPYPISNSDAQAFAAKCTTAGAPVPARTLGRAIDEAFIYLDTGVAWGQNLGVPTWWAKMKAFAFHVGDRVTAIQDWKGSNQITDNAAAAYNPSTGFAGVAGGMPWANLSTIGGLTQNSLSVGVFAIGGHASLPLFSTPAGSIKLNAYPAAVSTYGGQASDASATAFSGSSTVPAPWGHQGTWSLNRAASGTANIRYQGYNLGAISAASVALENARVSLFTAPGVNYQCSWVSAALTAAEELDLYWFIKRFLARANSLAIFEPLDFTLNNTGGNGMISWFPRGDGGWDPYNYQGSALPSAADHQFGRSGNAARWEVRPGENAGFDTIQKQRSEILPFNALPMAPTTAVVSGRTITIGGTVTAEDVINIIIGTDSGAQIGASPNRWAYKVTSADASAANPANTVAANIFAAVNPGLVTNNTIGARLPGSSVSGATITFAATDFKGIAAGAVTCFVQGTPYRCYFHLLVPQGYSQTQYTFGPLVTQLHPPNHDPDFGMPIDNYLQPSSTMVFEGESSAWNPQPAVTYSHQFFNGPSPSGFNISRSLVVNDGNFHQVNVKYSSCCGYNTGQISASLSGRTLTFALIDNTMTVAQQQGLNGEGFVVTLNTGTNMKTYAGAMAGNVTDPLANMATIIAAAAAADVYPGTTASGRTVTFPGTDAIDAFFTQNATASNGGVGTSGGANPGVTAQVGTDYGIGLGYVQCYFDQTQVCNLQNRAIGFHDTLSYLKAGIYMGLASVGSGAPTGTFWNIKQNFEGGYGKPYMDAYITAPLPVFPVLMPA